MDIKKILALGSEITDRYKLILKEFPKEKEHLLKSLAESCMLFTSFIASTYDECINEDEKIMTGIDLSEFEGRN